MTEILNANCKTIVHLKGKETIINANLFFADRGHIISGTYLIL